MERTGILWRLSTDGEKKQEGNAIAYIARENPKIKEYIILSFSPRKPKYPLKELYFIK